MSDNMDLKAGGVKHDTGKPRYDLMPQEFLDGVAEVLTYGANKYEDRNWEKGMRWGRPFAALMRHMWAWWGGEDLDPETKMPHLWHAGCNLAFLIAFRARKIGVDDRALPEDYQQKVLAACAAAAYAPGPRQTQPERTFTGEVSRWQGVPPGAILRCVSAPEGNTFKPGDLAVWRFCNPEIEQSFTGPRLFPLGSSDRLSRKVQTEAVFKLERGAHGGIAMEGLSWT